MNNHTIGKATLIVGVLSALLMFNACGGVDNNNASGMGGARSQIVRLERLLILLI